MTEAEWLVCGNPDAMLWVVTSMGGARERKHLLFKVACCRRVWRFMPAASRAAVEAVEGFADGSGQRGRLARAQTGARILASLNAPNAFTPAHYAARAALAACEWGTDVDSHRAAALAVRGERGDDGLNAECRAQCDLLRDVFRPFRPVLLDPAWLAHGAADLARRLDAGGAFADLPILADALEDVGCDNADLLGHLRGPGPHVRGCWALDLVLGKG
jgi:hypothetical protein